MSLADALTGTNVDRAVPAHELAAVIHLWGEGLITAAQALQGARVPQSAEADLQAVAAVFDAKTSAVAKLAYVLRVEKAAMLLQGGTISAAEFDALLEIGGG